MKATSDPTASTRTSLGEEAPPLRCAVIGSVDDGKSTLLGRLMLDSKSVMTDHLSHVEEASRRRGFGRVELALLTDGLRAEREQGITIDVAWRYFATAKRSFILADTPGHVQYTRNMLTGASTSDAVLLLIDAKRGPTEQTRRHVALTAMLGVPSVVVCINKMDEVGFDSARFHALAGEVEAMFAPFRARGGPRDITHIPIAALDGDNVVTRSARSPWFDGPTVLGWMEAVLPPASTLDEPLVFPVQWVVRHQDYRGWAGRIERGTVAIGDEVAVLPSGTKARVSRIDHGGISLEKASAGASIVVLLDRDVDASRGDVLVATGSLAQRSPSESSIEPRLSSTLDADLFWLGSTPTKVGGRYLVKHLTTRSVARLAAVTDSLDVDSLTRKPASTLALNEVGRVELRTARPLLWTPYEAHRGLGSFIVIDESTGDTVGAGLLRDRVEQEDSDI